MLPNAAPLSTHNAVPLGTLDAPIPGKQFTDHSCTDKNAIGHARKVSL